MSKATTTHWWQWSYVGKEGHRWHSRAQKQWKSWKKKTMNIRSKNKSMTWLESTATVIRHCQAFGFSRTQMFTNMIMNMFVRGLFWTACSWTPVTKTGPNNWRKQCSSTYPQKFDTFWTKSQRFWFVLDMFKFVLEHKIMFVFIRSLLCFCFFVSSTLHRILKTHE